ncbi:MAG: tRNA-specific adenosine deaminase [Micavibrio sp.]|nr:tRNA-specific adenosine deaminase [Micavibrio sp.]
MKQDYLNIALLEAKKSAQAGEIPVGAVLVSATGEIIAKSGNQCEATHDPTAHAEVLVIREAAKKLGSVRLNECDLYVTLEPCAMCAAAISFARIKRLYFGAYDPKGGGVDHGGQFFNQPTCHHAPEVYGGMDEKNCGDLLKEFFIQRR